MKLVEMLLGAVVFFVVMGLSLIAVVEILFYGQKGRDK
jgi:hypothetical protein